MLLYDTNLNEKDLKFHMQTVFNVFSWNKRDSEKYVKRTSELYNIGMVKAGWYSTQKAVCISWHMCYEANGDEVGENV